MSRYAIRVGEIHLRSDRPVTEEERLRAIRQLEQAYKGVLLVTSDGVEIKTVVH